MALGDCAAQADRPAAARAATASPAATVKQYCVTCHSDRLKTGGLTLAVRRPRRSPAASAEIWEKVVRKLRTGAMPPAARRVPIRRRTTRSPPSWKRELDRDALTAPNPGKLPLLHRLSRTEYQNAIRDLLALDALPKEMDYSLLLPADNSSSGFDNIADLLFVSPAIMERYLDAAEKISRLAVGDPNAPVMVNIYRLQPEQWQDARVDELPFGTRGGLAVRSYFPPMAST